MTDTPTSGTQPETKAMDTVPADADEFAGEPVMVDEHDLNEDSFTDADPEDVHLELEEQ